MAHFPYKIFSHILTPSFLYSITSSFVPHCPVMLPAYLHMCFSSLHGELIEGWHHALVFESPAPAQYVVINVPN